MKVPFLDLKSQYLSIKEDIESAIQDVIAVRIGSGSVARASRDRGSDDRIVAGISYTAGGIYGMMGFIAAVLGGWGSSTGAVVGGLVLGVMLNLLGTYVDAIGGQLRLAVALGVILAVLLVRPAGLFGKAAVSRV